MSNPSRHIPRDSRWTPNDVPAFISVLVTGCILVAGSCSPQNTGWHSPGGGRPGDSTAVPGDESLALPHASDWVPRGEVLSRGDEGAWDRYLYGGFTGTVVKKSGQFLLYYQGARDYSNQYGTVTHRAIGLATSTDGIHFTKHPGNPVVRWAPRQGIEEGAVSAGALLDAHDRVLLFYGANTQTSDTLVSADGRVAISADGVNFSDVGNVLDHRNATLWGSGDEVFPIVAITDDSTALYDVPNGVPDSRTLGVAWGRDWTAPRNSAQVMSEAGPVEVWGMGGAAKIGQQHYALFLNDVRRRRLEVRLVDLRQPHRVSAPLRAYTFDDFSQGVVYLDNDSATWFSTIERWTGTRTE